MPSVETSVVEIFGFRDYGFVEGLVMRVLELDVLEAFVLGHEAVSDDLNLRLVGDGLEVGVEDASLGIESLAVAVAGGSWVEALGQFELGLWRHMGLVFEDEDLVLEESVMNHVEIGICDSSQLTCF